MESTVLLIWMDRWDIAVCAGRETPVVSEMDRFTDKKTDEKLPEEKLQQSVW